MRRNYELIAADEQCDSFELRKIFHINLFI